MKKQFKTMSRDVLLFFYKYQKQENFVLSRLQKSIFVEEINPHGNKPPRAMTMPQRLLGLDMKLSQPNKLSRPKFNFKMGV